MNAKSIITAIALLATITASAQVITPDHEKRAKEIVSQMTIEEKIDYIGGYRDFYIRAVPRLGLPEVRMADGPQGVRNDTHSTMYPANILTTATWNRQMAYAMGKGIGRDCRARGVNIILGPGVNIYRSPLAGRSFEYTGEDPYLASEAALGYVQGVQDQGIMACIKHYAGNNQEWDRNYVSTDADERTMHEIYLPTFRKAVEKGHVASLMNSYNLLNGQWATESPWLNIEVLRKQWGFKGILMSDWGAVHSSLGPVYGGLDLEMPSAAWMNKRYLLPALHNGTITEQQIDLMCQHIIQTIAAFGWLDEPLKADACIALDDKENAQTALDIAREGVTLLKNNRDVLPLRGKTLVVGPNADVRVMGGGSGQVDPLHTVTTWQGLQTLLGKKVIRGEERDSYRHLSTECFAHNGKPGFSMQLWNNQEMHGRPAKIMQLERLNCRWDGEPCEGIAADHFSDRVLTTLTSPEDADIILDVYGDDGYRMMVNGTEVCSDWAGHGVTHRQYVLNAKRGEKFDIEIQHYEDGGNATIGLDAKIYDESNLRDPAYLAQFKNADNIVVCMGWNQEMETEGSDHEFSLPAEQLFLLRECANHGKKVIVVLNAGGNPNIAEWEEYADAILMAWYPGQEGGTAVAEVLTGKVNPSGKLPITIERRWEDNPCYNSYYDKRDVKHRRVQYTEGVFMGYRGYDINMTDVLYPFGHGLSYTTFAYSDLHLEHGTNKNEVVVSFTVKNTGKRDGKEVCQVYVSDMESSVPRPLKELKGFEKVELKKGESKRVSITLGQDAFEFFDNNTHSWRMEPGEFSILVGGSSRDLPLEDSITL